MKCRFWLAVLAASMLVSCHAPAPPFPADLDSVSSVSSWLDAQPEEAENEELNGRDLLEAWRFQLEMRAFPNDKVDWSVWAAASEARDVLPASKLSKRWEFVGPSNLPAPYQMFFGQGPVNGRVNAVALDPAHHDTYYACAAGGGVWKTPDRGKTWEPLSDGWPRLNASSIAVAPGGLRLFVGTGDFAYPAKLPGLGVLGSSDAGKTFHPCGPPELKNFAISRVLIDPDDPSVVTVSAGRGMESFGGVWQSRDDGTTWTRVVDEPAVWCDLAVSARDPQGKRAYYAIGYNAPGARLVYRSDDDGAHWKEVLRLGPMVYPGLSALAASPTDPNRVYAMFGGLRQIRTSTDRGEHWQDATGDVGRGGWWQDWYDLFLGASTSGGKDVLYAGLVDIMQAPPDKPWRSIGLCLTNQARIHCDEQAVAVDPSDPDHLLVGTDGGVYELDANGANVRFTSLNARLGVTQFYHAAFHPTDPNVMLGGSQDNSTPALQGDRWINVGGGDGGFCAIDPKNPKIQYASSQFLVLYRTTDGWKTTRNITPGYGSDRRAFIAPFTLDPSHPDWLYAGTNYLWRYDGATSTWVPRLGNQRLSDRGVVTCIAVAPGDSRTLYTGSNQGEVWMTRDGGTTWKSIAKGLPPRAVTCIAVDPKNPQSVVVALSGTGASHLWRCDDTSAGDWTSVGDTLPDIPVNSVVLDAPQTLYVGTDVGVFESRNGGAQWTNFTHPLGLPNVRVDDLVLVPGTGYLNAATFGRGMWRIQIHPLKSELPPPWRGSGDVQEARRRKLSPAVGTEKVCH